MADSSHAVHYQHLYNIFFTGNQQSMLGPACRIYTGDHAGIVCGFVWVCVSKPWQHVNSMCVAAGCFTLIPVSALTGAMVWHNPGVLFMSAEHFVYFLNWVNRSCLGLIYSLSSPHSRRNSEEPHTPVNNVEQIFSQTSAYIYFQIETGRDLGKKRFFLMWKNVWQQVCIYWLFYNGFKCNSSNLTVL